VNDLSNKVVLVTGAARGIGCSIARKLSRLGAHVILTDKLLDEVAQVARRIREEGGIADSDFLDITDGASAVRLCEATVSRLGRIDGLINNAGIDGPRGFAPDLGESDWRMVVGVDLTGPWLVTRAALNIMVPQKSGRIVFISSLSARVPAIAQSPAYAAAKAGLIGLTVSLSSQLEHLGILVNAITPGPTGNTGYPTPDADKRSYLDEHPLGFGGPEPIADGVAYLLGTTGDWISGAVLNISGGSFRGL
jgi:3-oxoacyl-[acyl-carrier protein] reductase